MEIEQLLEIMSRLRDKEHGCPWDIEQTFSSIVPHTIEEAYEVADAIEAGDMGSLKEELGDLLLQVVFYAQMGKEENLFTFDDIVSAIADKLIVRHPHVFGDVHIKDAAAQTQAWEELKHKERESKAAAEGRSVSILDGVNTGLPAMTRAIKLQGRAARVGFDWPDIQHVFNKLSEEVAELQEAISEQAQTEKLQDELGDILFVCVNLARHLGIDPEAALRSTNRKFVTRFHYIEDNVTASGKQLNKTSLDEMEKLWQRAKAK